MGDKLEKEKYFLQYFIHSDIHQQKQLIKNITKSQMDVIIEVIYNALMGNLTISEGDKNTVKRYRKIIRRLVSKGLTRRQRQLILLKYLKYIVLLIRPCKSWLKS